MTIIDSNQKKHSMPPQQTRRSRHSRASLAMTTAAIILLLMPSTTTYAFAPTSRYAPSRLLKSVTSSKSKFQQQQQQQQQRRHDPFIIRPFHENVHLDMVPNTKPPNTNRTNVEMIRDDVEQEGGVLSNNLVNASSSTTTTSSSLPSTNIINIKEEDNNKNKIVVPVNYHWTRKNLQLAIPALIGMLADPVLSLMDTVYVGRYLGPLDLAALGACTSIFHLAFNAFRACTTATTSLVATALAHASPDGNQEEAQYVTRISLQLGLVLGFIVFFGFLGGGTFALGTMGVHTSSALFQPACDYLFSRCWAGPAVLMIVVAEGVFRGYGDTTIPLIASAVASLINLVFDPIFMFPLGWGVKGAAAATAMSQVGAALVYGYFLRKRKMLPQGPRRQDRNREPGRLSLLSQRLQPFKRNRNNSIPPTAGITPITTLPATSSIPPPPLPPTSDSSAIPTAIGATTTASSSSSPVLPERVPMKFNSGKIIRAILGANLAMFAKQGSLLLAWTYATARATRLGHAHVAAHQVALSFWMIFALILDGAAVSAQVLMSRAHAQQDVPQVRSLIRYMATFATIQGVISTIGILLAKGAVPTIFTSDPVIRHHLVQLMPHLAFQQILVSVTLVMESLVVGANQFNFLAIGTAISTVFAFRELQQATTVVGIWSRGIVMLFAGRLLTAVIGTIRIYTELPPAPKSSNSMI